MKRNVMKHIIYIIITIFCFSFVGCKSKQSQSEVQEVSDNQMEVTGDNILNSIDNEEENKDDNNIVHNNTDVNEGNTEVIENDSVITDDTEDITEDTEDNTVNTEDNTEDTGDITEDPEDTADDIEDTTVVPNNGSDSTAISDDVNTNELPPTTPADSTEIVFVVTSETVYTTANVNIRTSYSLENDNIIVTLNKGISIERIGFNVEWSKILYQNKICYIKTKYLSTEQPQVVEVNNDTDKDTSLSEDNASDEIQKDSTNTDTAADEDFVNNLDVAAKITQLICVIGNGGSDCTVSFHKKNDAGVWSQQFSTDGDNGSKGITYKKKEGDGKTPAGLFSFTIAFGIKPDPGAKLSYRQITDYDYWIDDLESPYYNTWVNSLEIPGEYSSEHLIDHSPQYNYVMNINYNPDCTPGLGSAIFLHGYNGLGKTTGCIAIAEKYVKTLVKEVDSSTMILIVPNEDELAKY